MTARNIAFIGAGNMAKCIFAGMIDNGWPKENIWATTRSEASLEQVSHEYGVNVTQDNHEAVRQADIVVLAVKPQVMKDVLSDLGSTLRESRPLIISVAAGITLESLKQWSDASLPIVRCMPNTPSLLRCGASGLYASEQVTEPQREITEAIFQSVGITLWVETEGMIDTVIAVSGSGPAYYFLFMEAMTDVGVKLGLDRQTAEQLTLQTALGAANMALQSDVDAAELRRRVTSPGGTTEQAIRTFREGGLEPLVEKAMQAAVKHAEEMAIELGA